MEHHLLEFPNETKLPGVFATLLYAGKQKPYPYSLNLLDLFANRNLAERIFAKPAHLIDVTQIPDQEIKQHKIISLLEFSIKHIKDSDWSLLVKDVTEIINSIQNLVWSSKNILLYIKSNLYYIISTSSVEKPDEFVKQLKTIPAAGEIMGSLAQKLKKEGIIEGEAIGEKRTKKAIAISMLKKGFDIKAISEITGIKIEELTKLNSQIKSHNIITEMI